MKHVQNVSISSYTCLQSNALQTIYMLKLLACRYYVHDSETVYRYSMQPTGSQTILQRLEYDTRCSCIQ